MNKLTPFVFCFVVALSTSAKLPSTFKKCDRRDKDFNKCLPKAVEDAIRKMSRPLKEIGLPNLEPLELPALVIGAGNGPVGVAQNFKNVKLFGFSKVNCDRFDLDFDKKIIKMGCFLPQLKLDADYDLNGKVLLLPVYGKGSATVVLDKLSILLQFQFEEYVKKEKKYFKVVDTKMSLEPAIVRFNFENLFNGDKALGDNINAVLNDNWKEVFGDIKTNYEEAFQQIISGVFNKLLTKVPTDELFGPE